MKKGEEVTLPKSKHSFLPSNNHVVTATQVCYMLWSCQQKSDQFCGTKVKGEPLARVALCNNIISNQDGALVQGQLLFIFHRCLLHMTDKPPPSPSTNKHTFRRRIQFLHHHLLTDQALPPPLPEHAVSLLSHSSSLCIHCRSALILLQGFKCLKMYSPSAWLLPKVKQPTIRLR